MYPRPNKLTCPNSIQSHIYYWHKLLNYPDKKSMSKTPPHSNMDHPELLVVKSKSTTVVNTVSKTETLKSSSSLRHPAMIPPSIQEEENVSDLYELMPERLELESEIKVLSCNRKSNSIKHQAASSLKVKCSRWQHRSLSLPAVHGNFILLHREKREPRHITVSNSRLVVGRNP